MAANVATLTAKLQADVRGLQKGLKTAKGDIAKFEKQTTDATGKASKGFGGIGKAAAGLGVAFGALQVVSFARDSIAAFSSLEESVNAVNVVYGEAAEGIHELGLESADTFGLSTRAVNDAAVGMGAFVEKINEADPADAFKNIIQRATDFGSVMDITTEETLDKFRAGLSGEAEPLKKFGLDLSEATVKQVALDEGIIATGESMSATQKVQARYLTIMRQTEKTAGDFANTSDGLAGSQKKLSAKWEEAQATLGGKLAPAMTKLLQAGVDLLPVFSLVTDVFGAVIDTFGPSITIVSGLAKALGDLAGATDDAGESGGGVTDWMSGLVDAAVEIVLGTDAASGAIDQLEAFVNEAGEAAETAAPNLRLLADAHELVDVAALRVAGRLEEVTEATGDTAEAAEELAKEFKGVADKGRDVFKSVKTVQTLMRELVDPVFAAKRATDAYNEALAESRDDAIITADEFANLVELYGDMEAAESEVGIENIAAVAEQAGIVNRQIGGAAENSAIFMESLGSFDSRAFGAAEELTERMERLTSQPLDFSIAVTVPSRSDLQRALRRELEQLRRDGAFGGGFQQ